jgi:SAM-dependent methyltransferase
VKRTIITTTGRKLNLSYFVEWRPYLWLKPVVHALEFLGDLRGKRVLEIGGRYGRMTSLFALLGAEVTMLEKTESCKDEVEGVTILDESEVARAKDEVNKWGVADHVRLVQTKGGFDEISGETFDVIFTKSVLWCIEDLSRFLEQIDVHLADGGKVAFIENFRGGKTLLWLRRVLKGRGAFDYEHLYRGITPQQLPIFRRYFANVRIRRHRFFVYEIFGYKT